MNYSDWKRKFDENLGCCGACQTPLPSEEATYARKVQKFSYCGLCRARLAKVEAKMNACCEQAVVKPCVCKLFYSCQIHGDRHIGTHE